MRKIRRYKRKRQKKMIIILSLSLLIILTVGYAAFSTNLSITAKGNIKEYTTEDYVQDGLFLHLDGIYNTKQGHNQNATSWDNLIDNGYNLTMFGFSNGITWTSDNGLEFDGVDDYIDSGFKQDVLGNDITIDIVVNNEEINNHRGLVGYHWSNDYTGFAIQFNDNKLLWYYYGSDTECFIRTSVEQTKTLINKTSEITAIMSANNYISLYIDGEEVSTTFCSIPFEPWSRGDNLIIARTLPLSDRFFKGNIYNYKIYRKALTEEEVKQNYRVNKQRYDINND